MKTPTVPEVIQQLLLTKAIDQQEANRYLQSYQYFERERANLNADHSGKWVASFDNQIYVADSRQQLKKLIHDKPHANRAYIEHIGSMI